MEVVIQQHKNTHCASQSLWATLSLTGEKCTDVYDDIYRHQLSFALEFSMLTMKAAQCD